MTFNSRMHERNIYKIPPNFADIAVEYPELRKYVIPHRKGKARVDFTDPNALRVLTKILLKKDFHLIVDIPDGFLIPTVPQRLNYILWIEDLIAILPEKNSKICGIDVGTGPCAIFSMLGAKKSSWRFISTETSEKAIQWAIKNVTNNNLQSLIKIAKVSKHSILNEILSQNEDIFDFCLCNPPFFETIEEIRRKKPHIKSTIADIAQEGEIIAEGGEVAFVKNMITDSLIFKNRVHLYTSMFGRKKSFLQILEELKSLKDATYTTTEFCQGNTVRWGIAWTFLKSIKFEKTETPKPKKVKKNKSRLPLLYHIPKRPKESSYTVKKFFIETQEILRELAILMKVIQSTQCYAEIQLKTDKNTWSHQRRKRRELLKCVEDEVSTTDTSCNIVSNITSSSTTQELSSEPVNCDNKSKAEHMCNKANCVDIISLTGSAVPSEFACIESNSQTREKHTEHYSENVLASTKHLCLKLPCTKAHLDNTSFVCEMDIQNTVSNEIQKNENRTDDLRHEPENCHIPHGCENSEKNVSNKFKRKLESVDCAASKKAKKNFNFETTAMGKCCHKKPQISDSSQYKKEIELINSTESSKKLEEGSNEKEDWDSTSLQSILLYCSLKLRKAKNDIILEMSCPPDANRESMHQVFQFLKNKFK